MEIQEQFKKGMEQFHENLNSIMKGDFRNLFDPSKFSKMSTNLEGIDKKIFENQIKYQKAFIEYQKSIVDMLEATYDNFSLINKKQD
jgi:hypothetical protein